jgi:hypothetical protein
MAIAAEEFQSYWARLGCVSDPHAQRIVGNGVIFSLHDYDHP